MEIITHHTSKQSWWKVKSLKYNKGLAIAGIISILITSLLIYFIDKSAQKSVAVLYIGTPIYLLYIGTLNVIFFIFEFIDRQFPSRLNNKTKETFFSWFYWLSCGLPFLYPAFIISMF